MAAAAADAEFGMRVLSIFISPADGRDVIRVAPTAKQLAPPSDDETYFCLLSSTPLTAGCPPPPYRIILIFIQHLQPSSLSTICPLASYREAAAAAAAVCAGYTIPLSGQLRS